MAWTQHTVKPIVATESDLQSNNMSEKYNTPVPAARPVVLTIAGSDSGGGAGIQADLKTVMALGGHGLSAIAALTAQNTRGVTAIHRPPRRFLRAQLDALFDDFPVSAVKIGMLGTVPVIETVADVLRARDAHNIVLDPVMIASSGARLSERRALDALRQQLLPLADVLTPNLPEAEALLGHAIADEDAQREAASALLAQIRGGVLLKGGHLPGDTLTDLFLERDGHCRTWQHPRLPIEGHGTGCTLASAIATRLAHGDASDQAVDHAIAFLQRALANAYRPGAGPLYVPDVFAAAGP
jgi:hydroxymethylpyrimidine/phosphomethylpyrimidine kinase